MTALLAPAPPARRPPAPAATPSLHGATPKAVAETPNVARASTAAATAKPLEEALFDSRVDLKVATSHLAMHMSRDWRDRLFAQLDRMLDPVEWTAGDSLPIGGSYATFLRAMLYLKPARRPGLGLTPDGHIVAAWTRGPDRLSMEFRPYDQVRWIVSRMVDGHRDNGAGTTEITRLPDRLASWDLQHWFALGDIQPPA
jgi:hypothetical protein